MTSNYWSYNKLYNRTLLNTCLILKALSLLQNAVFSLVLYLLCFYPEFLHSSSMSVKIAEEKQPQVTRGKEHDPQTQACDLPLRCPQHFSKFRSVGCTPVTRRLSPPWIEEKHKILTDLRGWQRVYYCYPRRLCSQELLRWDVGVWFEALPFQPLHHCWEIWNSPKELLLDVDKCHFCICTIKAHEMLKHLLLVAAATAELARPPRQNARTGLFCPSGNCFAVRRLAPAGLLGNGTHWGMGKSGGCYSSEGSFSFFFNFCFSPFFFFFPLLHDRLECLCFGPSPWSCLYWRQGWAGGGQPAKPAPRLAVHDK